MGFSQMGFCLRPPGGGDGHHSYFGSDSPLSCSGLVLCRPPAALPTRFTCYPLPLALPCFQNLEKVLCWKLPPFSLLLLGVCVCVSKSCPLCIAAPRCFPLSNGIPEQAQCGQIFCSALFLRPPGIDIGVPARLHAMELAPFLK